MEQRLIDGNALLKHFSVSDNGTRHKLKDCDNFPITVNLEYVQKAIKNAPTVKTVQVIYGKWIDTNNDSEWFGNFYKCSECGEGMIGTAKYCSNCGAKMDIK